MTIPQIFDTAWPFIQTLGLFIFIVVSVRTYLLQIFWRIRVADLPGLIMFGIFIVVSCYLLADLWKWWSLIPGAAGMTIAAIWAIIDRRIIQALDSDESGDTIIGYFLVNRRRIPRGVRNWYS